MSTPDSSITEDRIVTLYIQRIFSFSGSKDYALNSVALLAAIGSGVALPFIQIVFGGFVTLVNDFAQSKAKHHRRSFDRV